VSPLQQHFHEVAETVDRLAGMDETTLLWYRAGRSDQTGSFPLTTCTSKATESGGIHSW